MYLHMNTFQMEHATYYAAFRYRFKVDRIFTDLWTKTALESDCFAYKYEYPYIFLCRHVFLKYFFNKKIP